MATDWNRPTFRVGAGHYDELHAAAAQGQEGNAEEEKGDEGRDDGRGSAVMDGAPKPQPGDELYATLYQARAEATERASAQQPHPDMTTAADFAALVALSAQSGSEQQHQAEGQDSQAQRMTIQESAGEVTQPSGQHQDRGSLHNLRMENATALTEQAATTDAQGPQRPNSRNGLLADFVTDETRARTEAEQEQTQTYQRRQVMGLSL